MRAFTLIELVAVLVIMAILALIVTPLVMNIIRKARIAADKRSIDAYGRSIELAIAGYLLDTGKFPTSIDQLSIEYSGDIVSCTTEQINTDSSVYLAGCTVKNRNVEGYTYGKYETPTYTAYQVGDHISYKGITYYVIEDSDSANNTVKLLKENPLTKTEMDNLNLNNITIDEWNGYGRVQYGSSVEYSQSTVKQVVDAWTNSAVKSGDNAISRLITYDDLTNNLGFEKNNEGTVYSSSNGNTPSWVYNSNYDYWTISQYGDSSNMWKVHDNGSIFGVIPSESHMVRPVLEISKVSDLTKLAS